MSWLHDDLHLPVDAPIKGASGHRVPSLLALIVEQFHVETAERYVVRDVDHDGKDDTFCNFFLSDVTRALGCQIPQRRANDQLSWLERDGNSEGWWRVGPELAHALSEVGVPVVAAWRNPDGGSGHVALLVPPAGGGILVAQAGRRCFSSQPLEVGFGTLQPSFWSHA